LVRSWVGFSGVDTHNLQIILLDSLTQQVVSVLGGPSCSLSDSLVFG
jgi:hypothetical protein